MFCNDALFADSSDRGPGQGSTAFYLLKIRIYGVVLATARGGSGASIMTIALSTEIQKALTGAQDAAAAIAAMDEQAKAIVARRNA